MLDRIPFLQIHSLIPNPFHVLGLKSRPVCASVNSALSLAASQAGVKSVALTSFHNNARGLKYLAFSL